MAGSLIKVEEYNVSSAVATIDLGLTNWDSSYNIYVLQLSDLNPATASAVYMRFYESSVLYSGSNYKYGSFATKGSGADENKSNGASSFNLSAAQQHATLGSHNGTYWIHNANVSDSKTFVTWQQSMYAGAGEQYSNMGGGLMNRDSAVNGLQLYNSSSYNFTSGKCVLYGLLK